MRSSKVVSSLDVFCEVFSSLGFKRVEAEFNGYGDSGNLEAISLIQDSGKIVSDNLDKFLSSKANKKNNALNQFSNNMKNIISEYKNLNNYLENFLCELLPGGFEINEGSYGTVEVDLKTGKIDIDQNYNPEYDSDDSEFTDE